MDGLSVNQLLNNRAPMVISLRAGSWRFLETGKQDLISFYSRVTTVLWSSKVMNFYLSVKSSSGGAVIGDTLHRN